MSSFMIRLIVFIGLWICIFVQLDVGKTFSLFMLSLSLISFYFLSYPKGLLVSSSMTIVLLFVHGMVIEEAVFSSLLILLVLIALHNKLRDKYFYSLLGVSSVLIFLLALFTLNDMIEMVVSMIFILGLL